MNENKKAVINDDLIRKCCTQHSHMSQETQEGKDQELEFWEIKTLIFSFKNIVKISNLVGLKSLTKLKLDNNSISKIENLSHLSNLEWLDLSFNEIEKIEGLENLEKLKDLTLYHNSIKNIENMDSLINLECLSLGKNLIEDKEELAYLRRFENLKLLTLKGNPICEGWDIQMLVLAYTKNLKYLDYRLVDPSEVTNAREHFHEKLKKIEETERKEKEEIESKEEKDKKDAQLLEENLYGIDELFESMMKTDNEYLQESRIVFENVFEDYKETFTKYIEHLTEIMRNRKKQKEEHWNALQDTLKKEDEKNIDYGRKHIKDFEKKRKTVIRESKDVEDEEAVEMLDNLVQEVERIAQDMVEREVTQAEDFADVLTNFEMNMKEFREGTEISTLFANLRDEEVKYNNAVKEKIEECAEKIRGGEDVQLNENVRMFISDKDNALTVVEASLTSHTNVLDTQEEKMQNREEKWYKNLISKINEDEHTRNRRRIAEIWSLVDNVQKEVDEEKEELM
eukprot:gb/GECH01001370.1/.p1 GENE.gb/GECH01001370.1/~~gb/GECH01001370.1/.p1  ORF type:complete len:511 (+),score=178.49 gb/GECH01001370.1/:1-1533(+)